MNNPTLIYIIDRDGNIWPAEAMNAVEMSFYAQRKFVQELFAKAHAALTDALQPLVDFLALPVNQRLLRRLERDARLAASVVSLVYPASRVGRARRRVRGH